eukprot:13510_1
MPKQSICVRKSLFDKNVRNFRFTYPHTFHYLSKQTKMSFGKRRSGDWMCPTCNFLIWGSKSSCKKCGAKRPIIKNNHKSRSSDQKQNDSNNNFSQKQKFKYLVVLDFEATCDENTRIWPQEIIEWPAMIIDTSTNTILKKNTFHFYIKPKHNPKLTKFCQELTGITQTFLNTNGSKNTIQSVLKQWNVWCIKNNLCPQMINNIPVPNACIITCGNWDLKTMWTQQQETSNCSCPFLFHSWINIKDIFKTNMNKISKKKNKYGMGMMGMLHYCNIKHEGRHHSGIDDVFNICKIVQKFLSIGVNFKYTTCNFRKRSIWNDITQQTSIIQINEIEQKQDITQVTQHKTVKRQKFRYLVVLDFEATCDTPRSPNPQEIIEWPAMIIDTVTNKILRKKFHYYIKPKIHPKLSDFCIKLTGITQEVMENEGANNTIESVVDAWNKWCYENNLLCSVENKPNACIVTHFDADLEKFWTMQQAAAKCLEPVLFHSWINICVPVEKHLDKFKCAANNYGERRFKRGLKKLLGYLGIEHQGRQHSGIDDVRNICKIVQKCLDVGVVFDYTTKNYGGRHIKNDVICLNNFKDSNKKKNDENI